MLCSQRGCSVGAALLCLCSAQGCCLPSLHRTSAACGMPELSRAPPWAAPAAPAATLVSSSPGKWISNINMRGWMDPQPSLGRECSCSLHECTKSRGSQVPIEFPREDKPVSFLLSHQTSLGLASPSRAAHVAMANPVPEWPLAQGASRLRAYVLQIQAAEEGGGFPSELLFATGL